MARIKQFANDLGISYDQAKSLIEQGRRQNDRGSMIMKKYKDGGASTKVQTEEGSYPRTPHTPTKGGTRYAPAVPLMEERGKKKLSKGEKLKRRGDDEKVIKAASGKYNSHGGGCGCDACSCGTDTVRGMGKAYMGNPRAAKIR